MEDNLKKQVDQNRRQFEIYETDLEGLWKDIAGNLGQQQKRKTFSLSYGRFFKVAAVVLLLLGAGWIAQRLTQNPAIAEQKRISKLYPELAEAEQYYAPMIAEKMQVVQMHRTTIGEEVFKDLDALDKAYRELKEDLKDEAANAEVIDAMIQNYRIKLQILEEISKQIKKQNDDPQKSESVSM